MILGRKIKKKSIMKNESSQELAERVKKVSELMNIFAQQDINEGTMTPDNVSATNFPTSNDDKKEFTTSGTAATTGRPSNANVYYKANKSKRLQNFERRLSMIEESSIDNKNNSSL